MGYFSSGRFPESDPLRDSFVSPRSTEHIVSRIFCIYSALIRSSFTASSLVGWASRRGMARWIWQSQLLSLYVEMNFTGARADRIESGTGPVSRNNSVSLCISNLHIGFPSKERYPLRGIAWPLRGMRMNGVKASSSISPNI
jgi:hypothetical protein